MNVYSRTNNVTVNGRTNMVTRMAVEDKDVEELEEATEGAALVVWEVVDQAVVTAAVRDGKGALC